MAVLPVQSVDGFPRTRHPIDLITRIGKRPGAESQREDEDIFTVLCERFFNDLEIHGIEENGVVDAEQDVSRFGAVQDAHDIRVKITLSDYRAVRELPEELFVLALELFDLVDDVRLDQVRREEPVQTAQIAVELQRPILREHNVRNWFHTLHL